MEDSVNVTFRVPVWLDRVCTWPMMVWRKWKYGEAFRRIDLGEGEFTIVDAADYYRYGKFKWSVVGTGRNLYAVRNVKVGPKLTKIVRLHREIMNAPRGILVDHKNNDGLDNLRSNLRLATHSQNQCNKRKTGSKTSSKFRGVYFDKRRVQWQGYIRYNGKRMYLGKFNDETAAARAYDRAAREYHKEFAKLNFPEENQKLNIRK
jgi:hypothetical protein